MELKEPIKRQSIWVWDEDYPYSLTSKELQEPLLALEDVFSNYSLKDCHYLLWEWKHCNYRPYLFSFGNGVHTLYHFMCKLQKLLNVAWLIHKDFSFAQLLVVCDNSAFKKFRKENYCIFLNELDSELTSIIAKTFNEQRGLQGFMNVLYHWWDLGVDWRHLDVGDRGNVGGEIPEFRRLALIVEITSFIYKSNDMKDCANTYASRSFLSSEEGKQPVETIMKIFSRWEYEDFKKLLRTLFYTMNTDGGLEQGIMGDRGGIAHTYHKLIDLAHKLSLKDDAYFEDEKHFTLAEEKLGSFWMDHNTPPLHHLPEVGLAFLINRLKSIDYDLLHRNLYELMLFLVSHESIFTNNYTELVLLFQRLEEVFEVLYLIMLNRVQIDW